MTEAPTHAILVELSEPLPEEVPAGAGIVLKVNVSCAAGCDLRGAPVKVTAPDGTVVAGELATFDAGRNTTGDITLKAPKQVGGHAWSLVVPAREVAGVAHADGTLAIHVKTTPHGTSLAAWDIPSPVVTGTRFEIKAGAKSASGCDLRGTGIAVYDETGAELAHGHLQDAPWPGTSALYWTTLELIAPAREGLCSWSIKFATPEIELPHDSSSTEFSFVVRRPPEHRLTVRVVEKETRAPVENALVRLGAYRAATDQSGIAEVDMPKGTFDLVIWKVGYENPTQTMNVSEDVSVVVEVEKLPEENPDAHWTM
jgi:hypothetical protein